MAQSFYTPSLPSKEPGASETRVRTMSQAQVLETKTPETEILTQDVIESMRHEVTEAIKRIEEVYSKEIREDDKKRIIRDIAVHVFGKETKEVYWSKKKAVAHNCVDMDFKNEKLVNMLRTLLYVKGAEYVTLALCARTEKLRETNEELYPEDEEIVNEIRRIFNRPVFSEYENDDNDMVVVRVPIYENVIHDIPVTIYFRIRFSRYPDP